MSSRRWPSLEARMAARVDRSGGPDACWPYMGSRDPRGYGRIADADHGPGAHIASRLAYELHHGVQLHFAVKVRHSCDNPPCCNPVHLLAGSQADNVADAVARGRLSRGDRHSQATRAAIPRGVAHHAARLSPRKVRAIRKRSAAGVGSVELARLFAVDPRAIRKVLSGETWGHVS